MTGPGPTAAAAAVIGQIPPALRAAAQANTTWSELTALAQIAIFLVVCLVLLRSGLLVRLRSSLRERGLAPWAVDAVCGGAFGALILAAGLPLAATDALRAHPAAGWGGAVLRALSADVAPLLAIAIAAPVLLPFVRRWPKAWGLTSGVVLGALFFALVWLPYARASGPAALPPAPAGPARQGLLRLVKDTRTPAGEIYLSAYKGIDADVTGTGEDARVTVSRGLWAKASPSTLRASIGHLMGHYHHHDQLSLALLLGVLTLATLVGTQLVAPPLGRRLGRGQVQGPGDPAALPALAAVLAVFLVLATVADHAFIRAINVRADQYSLDNAREPDGLAQALLLEWRGERVDPSPLEEAMFYDHPSLKSRLIHAMTWKADHPG